MGVDLSFEVATVEAFHLVLGGKSYWEGYLSGRDVVAERFLTTPGWRTVYPRQVETVFVKVALEDGTIGWGEPNAPIGPEITGLIATALIQPVIRGRRFESPQAFWDFLYDTERGRGHGAGFYLDAMAGLEIAVWDALGRRNGLPLASLLTERPRATIPVYLSGLRQSSCEERIAHARDWAQRGLTGVKIFLAGDTAAGRDELAALQAGVPEIRRWMVDVLWSYEEVAGAADAKRAYGDLGAAWLECPLLPEDLAGHVELAGHPGARVALGESFHTRFEATPWLEAGALQVFQPDVGRAGISDTLRQMEIARRHGIATTPHMGSGLDLFQAATLHVAAACEDEHLCEYQAALAGRLGGALDTGWRFADGAFALPDRPGLGVEVDEAALGPFLVART